eukprot:6367969-Prymnesium_polylepis.1
MPNQPHQTPLNVGSCLRSRRLVDRRELRPFAVATRAVCSGPAALARKPSQQRKGCEGEGGRVGRVGERLRPKGFDGRGGTRTECND